VFIFLAAPLDRVKSVLYVTDGSYFCFSRSEFSGASFYPHIITLPTFCCVIRTAPRIYCAAFLDVSRKNERQKITLCHFYVRNFPNHTSSLRNIRCRQSLFQFSTILTVIANNPMKVNRPIRIEDSKWFGFWPQLSGMVVTLKRP